MTRAIVQGPPFPLAATARFSSTVRDGNTRRPCGTSPSPSATARFEGHAVMSRSLKRTWPRRGGVKPMMERISVVLPMPFRPRMPTTWPFSIRSETP